jgi:predicted Zn-ribbon and HTH transcriptional regulator
MKLTSDVRPPNPGEREHFICQNCGHRFMEKINFLGLPPKCPKCGSQNISRDPAIVH